MLKCNAPPYEIQRQAMLSAKGGNTQVGLCGVFKDVQSHDFDSAYVASAASFKRMPLPEHIKRHDTREEIFKAISGVCRVIFQAPDKTYAPIFPVYGRDGRILYVREGVSDCGYDTLRLGYRLGYKIYIVNAFGFTDGVPDFPEYYQMCLDERNREKALHKGSALDVMWKLAGNSPIGKWFQHQHPASIDLAFALGKKTGQSVELLIKHTPAEVLEVMAEQEGIPVEVMIGAYFFPFHNAITTDRPRAALSALITIADGWTYSHTDCAHCHGFRSDPTAILDQYGIKMKHERTDKAIVIRTRFGGVLPHEKLAHHTVPRGEKYKSIVKAIFDRFESGERNFKHPFNIEKPAKEVEAIRRGLNLGQYFKKKQEFNASWDNVRKLCDNGIDTLPWQSIEEIPYVNWRRAE